MRGKTIRYLVTSGRLIVIAAVGLLFSCSPVKFVPEDRYLLNKVEVDIDNPLINKEEVEPHVRQKGNYKILGFAKFYLWLYNLSSKKKTDSWLKRIGEPPEIFDEALVKTSEDQLKQYLGNRGFFRASVDTEIKLKGNTKKVNVRYKIKTGNQYSIRKINYHFGDSALRALFF